MQMRRIFLQSKTLRITAVLALFFTLLFSPFIQEGPYSTSMILPQVCHIDAFGIPRQGCDSVTIFDFIQSSRTIVEIAWKLFVISYVIFFIVTFGEIQLFLSILKWQKAKKKSYREALFWAIFVLIVADALLILLLYYFGGFILDNLP